MLSFPFAYVESDYNWCFFLSFWPNPFWRLSLGDLDQWTSHHVMRTYGSGNGGKLLPKFQLHRENDKKNEISGYPIFQQSHMVLALAQSTSEATSTRPSSHFPSVDLSLSAPVTVQQFPSSALHSCSELFF